MKAGSNHRPPGFTLIELLFVIAVLVVVAIMIGPPTSSDRRKAQLISCLNNQKQVGYAFRIWANDHNGLFPMQLSLADGGTMELVSGPNAFRHFQVMSNELETPKILFCPSDSDPLRATATTFESARGGAPQLLFAGNSNLSYFLGVDAVNSNATMFLTGDRNITNGIGITEGLLNLATNRLTGWTGGIHRGRGNICFADGYVQSYTTIQVARALEKTATGRARLTLP